MNSQEVLDVFRSCDAILDGHFILSSGLRSATFLQKQRVFMYADKAEILCKALAEKIIAEGYGDISQVVFPGNWRHYPGLRNLSSFEKACNLYGARKR